MKALLLGLLLLFSAVAFATSYTSTQSGDFNSVATWGGRGFPHTGDTWTIISGTSVTCSGVCASGAATPSSCSVNGTVKMGGSLTVAAGATLTHSGELDVQHGATLNVYADATGSGTLAIAPGAGATCKLSFANPGTGVPVFNLVGTAGTNGNNSYAVLTCNNSLHAGAACMVTPEVGGMSPSLNFDYFKVTNFGAARTLAFSNFGVSSASIQNGLFNNNGNVKLTLGTCTTCNFTVQNVSFTNPVDALTSHVFDFYGTGAKTSGTRTVMNVTASSHSTTVRYMVDISIPGLQTGASALGGDGVDINGFVGYNVALVGTTNNAVNQVFRGTGVILDAGLQSASCYGFFYNAGLQFQDSFCVERLPNQHEIVSGTAATGGSPNLYQRYLCDGDGFYNFDTGDMIQDWGTYTLQNSIGLNFCGAMTTISNGGTEVATVTQNTNYNNFGETYCETACYDGVSPVFRNNLLVKPADSNGRGVRGDDGLHSALAFQRQTNLSLDYNGFYQMPGSGDPGSEPQPPVPMLIPNPALGGIVSYLNLPSSAVGMQQNKLITTVTDPTHIGCSSCNFTQPGAAGVMPGDYFVDITSRLYATVASVTDATHLVLADPGISGMLQGHDGLTIYNSYWNHPGWYYGDSNNGSHDIHANPIFVDSSRTLCTWYRANTSAQLSCPTYGSVMTGVSLLRGTAGTGGTTVVCFTCNFTANGVSTADVVRVFTSTGQNIRGSSAISSVTGTTLTLTTSIPGLAVGDTFDFITATRGLGPIIVQSAGFDWNGNSVTPPAWATVAGAMRYVYSGFAPQNFVYKNAGSPADGFPDIGAVPVAGGSINR